VGTSLGERGRENQPSAVAARAKAHSLSFLSTYDFKSIAVADDSRDASAQYQGA